VAVLSVSLTITHAGAKRFISRISPKLSTQVNPRWIELIGDDDPSAEEHITSAMHVRHFGCDVRFANIVKCA